MAPSPGRSPGTGPDFICVGAQKGGTRWLYDQLQLHPDFWMPPVKELHYFDRGGERDPARRLLLQVGADIDGVNRARRAQDLREIDRRDIDFLERYVRLPRWRLDLGAYADLFSGKGSALSGDITPDYSKLGERRIRRVARRFASVRIVFIARDPVQRLWSHVCMHVRQGDVGRALDERMVARLLGKRFITSRSFQTDIVARWRRHIPPERFGLFLFDDLATEPESLRRRVLAFLGGNPSLPSGPLPAGFNRKESNEKIPLTDELRNHIAHLMAEELTASARIFGGAAAGWPGRYGF